MKTRVRARGALYGLAIGDALGMPTQMLSRPQIVARWGTLLAGFELAPPGHPIAAGLPAGTVTDDTEQARRACWPPRWAATATRSRPWWERWPEPAMASGRSRPTRSPSSMRRISG